MLWCYGGGLTDVPPMVLCVLGHGLLPGGTTPAGDPRPAASLLPQPGRAAPPGPQELRDEEGRPGQVRLRSCVCAGRAQLQRERERKITHLEAFKETEI